MKIITDETIQKDYTYYFNSSATENCKLCEEESKKECHGSLGKYQFFSDDRDKLIELAKKILIKFNLFHAKISKEKREGDKGFGYVLCVYDYKPQYKYEVRKYADENEIKYRYWKSDEDSQKGKYSKEFLKNLSKKERGKWIKQKI